MKKVYAIKVGLRLIVGMAISLFIGFMAKMPKEQIVDYVMLTVGVIFFLVALLGYLNRDNLNTEQFSFGRYSNTILNKVGLDHIPSSNHGVLVQQVDVFSNIIAGILLIIPSIVSYIIQ